MILTIIGITISALILTAALLLLIPYEYFFEGRKYEELLIRMKISWFKGAVGFNYIKEQDNKAKMFVNLFNIKIKLSKNKKDSKEEKKDKKEDGHRNYLDSRFLKCAMTSLKKVLLHIKPKRFIFRARLGFEDPAITGMACALTDIFYTTLKGANIRFEPVFDDEIYEGECIIQGRVVLIVIAYIAFKLYLSRPVKIKPKIKEVKLYGK